MPFTFPHRAIYIGKRKNLPDSIRNAMTQEDNIIVFLAGEGVSGYNPTDWVNEHINEPLRPRTEREKKSGRYK